MAVKNIDNYTAGDGFGLPLNIRRGNPNPLDNSYLWGSYEEAAVYAATSPIAYVGQLIAAYQDVEVEQPDGTKAIVKTVCVYVIINEKGDLFLLNDIKSSQAIEVDLDKIKELINIISQKQDEQEQKTSEIVQKQNEQEQKTNEITQKQNEIDEKQEQLQKDQEEINKKLEETQKELEDNIKDNVDKIIEDQEKENTNIKNDIGEVKNPETGEINLPEDTTNLVDAINKVNDKIVDPRDEDDQWATEEDVDDLYSDLFSDLGW